MFLQSWVFQLVQHGLGWDDAQMPRLRPYLEGRKDFAFDYCPTSGEPLIHLRAVVKEEQNKAEARRQGREFTVDKRGISTGLIRGLKLDLRAGDPR